MYLTPQMEGVYGRSHANPAELTQEVSTGLCLIPTELSYALCHLSEDLKNVLPPMAELVADLFVSYLYLQERLHEMRCHMHQLEELNAERQPTFDGTAASYQL